MPIFENPDFGNHRNTHTVELVTMKIYGDLKFAHFNGVYK